MDNRLQIVVAGTPIPQDRRVVPRKSKAGKVFFGTLLNEDCAAWRQRILHAARRTPGFPVEPWAFPVRVTIDAFFPRTREMEKPHHPDVPILKSTKPDADNLVKSVLDALTPPRSKRGQVKNDVIKAALRRGYLWLDDGQVHLGPITRWWVERGCQPGLIIVAEPMPATSPRANTPALFENTPCH